MNEHPSNVIVASTINNNRNIKVLTSNERAIFIHVDNIINSSDYSDFVSQSFGSNVNDSAKIIFIYDDVMIDIESASIIAFINNNVIPNEKYLVIHSLRNIPLNVIKSFKKILIIKDTEHTNDIVEEFKNTKIDFALIDDLEDISFHIDLSSNKLSSSESSETIEKKEDDIDGYTIEIKKKTKKTKSES